MCRPTKIDFNNTHQNQVWLDYFGASGLDVVCKTASEIRSEGNQDLWRINWGGAVFEQSNDSPRPDSKLMEIYFARLAIDLKTTSPHNDTLFTSAVGAARDFEIAVEDLKEKIEKRVIQSVYDTMYAPKGTPWAGNREYAEPELFKLGYRDIISADLSFDFG